MSRLFHYVGPPEIAKRAASGGGHVVTSAASLQHALESLRLTSREMLTVTYVIAKDELLRVAPRQSEHVACAKGQPVLAAGEMTFGIENSRIAVERITNQSTGYCPDVTCWDAVASTLDCIPVERPNEFDPPFVFRRCASCSQINIVKDAWYECAVCDTALPNEWNFVANPERKS